MKQQSFPYAFFQNKIVKIENAKVSIMTNALQYGTAIFGGIRGYVSADKRFISIFRIEDHYKRMLSSAKILGCSLPYMADELATLTIKLIKKNKPMGDIYLRPFAYSGHTNLGPNLANTIFDFSLHMIPLDEYLSLSKGLNVMISSWRRIPDNSIPPRAKISGAYVNSALARKEAYDGGFDEAIMLTQSGQVSEGSAENIFIVRDGVLITPAESDDILEGITRRSVIQIAKDIGIPFKSRTVSRSELYVCDEAFFSGTGAQIPWIKSIDKRIINDGKKGKITSIIQEKFFNIVRGNDDKYSKWCTKIAIID
ncbi:MAG: branched-chain amino acid transaminase [bacterium]|nr:branched-chain amino acid transaminase [bacterium]